MAHPDFWSEDKPKEECGVFGIYGTDLDVSRLTYYGLYALQHRGQESAGIAVSDGKEISVHKNMGLVSEVFSDEDINKLKGKMAIGHVRYSTTGSSNVANAQPLVLRYLKGMVSFAHNGNLTNAAELRETLGTTGSIFQTTTDSEIIVNLFARYSQSTPQEALMKCMIDLKGAYCLVVMAGGKLFGVRDPHGFRPLCIGRLGDAYILASESCALDTIGATFVRDVEPGEIVMIDESGLTSIQPIKAPQKSFCVFEYIYFARPDSTIDGINVSWARRKMGEQLAYEAPLEADIVIPVPDSGKGAAIGYATASGIPFEEGLIKNRYIGRTFIQPNQETRDLAVRLKLNANSRVINGKRVIMVDDSIVRGTTSSRLVQILREAGATEVHMLICSPPVLYPCYYGIDTAEREKLIATQKSVEGIRQHIGADSLHYLSKEGMLSALGNQNQCLACFSGDYPVNCPKEESSSKYNLE
ncbi:MAG TPA: amidophosphoribosyltransferase [Verrucomicrobiae bacterium]|nr:amidophosphoribosyltransferase [Verrucomicrobiae bacterium]